MKRATPKQIELIKRLISDAPEETIVKAFNKAKFPTDGDWSEMTVKQANTIIRTLNGGRRRWGSF